MSLLIMIEKLDKWTSHTPMKPAKELAGLISDVNDQTQKDLQVSVFSSPKSPHSSIPFWPFRKINDYGIQEAEIISAQYATHGWNHIKRYCALRIFPHDLRDLDIQVVQNPGGTGVKAVDELHWDIQTSKNAFIQLIERVCQGLNRGEDRVRILGKQDLKEQLQRFLVRSDEDVDARTKRNARKALKIN
ncbi:MAG: hypothetical protein IID46_09530 [Planctomycetes bacterium]|nr:hypothetical protein [Planctomycetota bacterium]